MTPVVCLHRPITVSGADLGLSGSCTNLAIMIISGHFLRGSAQIKYGEHYTVYDNALHASEHKLLALSSHIARVFYIQQPKSTTHSFSPILVKNAIFLGPGTRSFFSK